MAQETTKTQETTKKQKKREIPQTKDLFIYLGPPVTDPDLHLIPGTVFKKGFDLPKELSFLKEWFVCVEEHKKIVKTRQEIGKRGTESFRKWHEHVKKIAEYIREKRKAQI